MPLTLDIATPEGVALSYANLDRVVLRRASARSSSTNEVVFAASQPHTVVRLPAQIMRARSGGDVMHIEIDAGFAEATDDSITVLTRGARVIAIDQRLCPAAS